MRQCCFVYLNGINSPNKFCKTHPGFLHCGEELNIDPDDFTLFIIQLTASALGAVFAYPIAIWFGLNNPDSINILF